MCKGGDYCPISGYLNTRVVLHATVHNTSLFKKNAHPCWTGHFKKKTAGHHGGLAVSTVASQQEGRGFETEVISVWSLHGLPTPAWVFPGCCGFLSPSKKNVWDNTPVIAPD